MQRSILPTSSLAAFAVLGGCVFGGGQDSAPAELSQLNERVEYVIIEAERAREAVADAFERLNQLAGGRFDQDPAPVMFARLVASVDVAEQLVKKYRERVQPMVAFAGPFFAAGQQDIEKFTSESMRKRREVRLQVQRERYQALAEAAVPAQQEFESFVKSLRDHVLFLGHDLTAGAIDAIQDDVKEVAKVAVELDRKFETTSITGRTFVDQYSVPAAAPSGR